MRSYQDVKTVSQRLPRLGRCIVTFSGARNPDVDFQCLNDYGIQLMPTPASFVVLSTEAWSSHILHCRHASTSRQCYASSPSGLPSRRLITLPETPPHLTHLSSSNTVNNLVSLWRPLQRQHTDPPFARERSSAMAHASLHDSVDNVSAEAFLVPVSPRRRSSDQASRRVARMEAPSRCRLNCREPWS